MKYHLEWPTELQALEKKFLREIETLEKEFVFNDHSPVFYQIIETKIEFLKEYLGILEANTSITLAELAALVDQRLETEERAMDKSTNVFETDKIFNNVRILGWIKYLIIEKNGQVPDSQLTAKMNLFSDSPKYPSIIDNQRCWC
ncbi:MAG TPA: hypothetical protein VH415_08185 [Nitrososphaeraceae archaeon]|jgi:hypothetical protein